MRKITSVIIGLFMVISFSTIASAETQTSASSGAAVTFAASSATCPGPTITYTPSPSTIISATTSDIAFAITSGSTKAAANAIEFGILNTDPGMYQRTIADTSTYVPAPTTSATALPGTGWADKGGNAPSGGS